MGTIALKLNLIFWPVLWVEDSEALQLGDVGEPLLQVGHNRIDELVIHLEIQNILLKP